MSLPRIGPTVRSPYVMNAGGIVSLIIAPAIGTLITAYVADYLEPNVGRDQGASFAFTLLIGGLYSYMAVPLMAACLFALRYWRIDYIWMYPLVGWLLGSVAFAVVLEGPAGILYLPALIMHPGPASMVSAPLAISMLVVGLFAGKRI
ncbi:hypothetical protein BMP26_005216 [Escherichia coli]|nr:hypothetical protein [Escherichia coli]